MLDVALKVFFAGLLLAWVVHPYAGIAVMGAAVALLLWELWAAMALPFLAIGALWARLRANRPAAH